MLRDVADRAGDTFVSVSDQTEAHGNCPTHRDRGAVLTLDLPGVGTVTAETDWDPDNERDRAHAAALGLHTPTN